MEEKPRDKHHQKVEGKVEKEVPQIVFDCCFSGSEGENTVAIQATRGRRTRMIFATVVRKKGFLHEHGATELIKDIARQGYNEITLKCDGEPGLRTIQQEVRADDLGELASWSQSGERSRRARRAGNRRAGASDTAWIGAKTRTTFVWEASRHGMAGGAFAVDFVAFRSAPPVACKDPSRQSECSPGSFVLRVQLTCFE